MFLELINDENLNTEEMFVIGDNPNQELAVADEFGIDHVHIDTFVEKMGFNL